LEKLMDGKGDEARPYRPQDIDCAVGAFLRALWTCEPVRVRFEAFAAELQLNEAERYAAAAVIGVRLPEQPQFRNANLEVDHALASRSLIRRARRRQLE
jgi:hypothetical protein